MAAAIQRETLVAIPDWCGDIYRRHQLVWRAMHAHASRGRQFVFCGESPHIVRVRSAWLPRGDATYLRDGLLKISLVSARRDGDKMTAVGEAQIPKWAATLLREHGLETVHITVENTERVYGKKSAGQAQIRIRLPIAHLLIQVRVTNPAKAELAWANGVGRGKRFGFGMLMPTR